MSDDHTPEDLERLAAGELDHLPPAPRGTADSAGDPDPEDVFTPPEGNTPYSGRSTVDDNRTPENEETMFQGE